jgi:hypothetical protein
LALPLNEPVAAILSPGTAVTSLAEEEISDITLATFHVYDTDSAGVTRFPLLQITRYCGGCGPCAGCSGGPSRCRCSGGGRCKS